MKLNLLALAATGLALSSGVAWAGNPAAIPEPSSLTLLAAAIGGIAWAKFRRPK